jgi:predicted O-methyltransferase YrrM
MPTPDLTDVLERVGGPMSLAECEALADLAATTTAHAALEVGHYLGRSTSVLLTSLPESCSFVTIDHHKGDDWCPATSFDTFLENVEPYITGDRDVWMINQDMRVALPRMLGRFGFVFYDGDHTAAAVADFWELAEPLLEDECTLCFDDADWAEQSTLRALAEDAGFVVVTGREFYRPEGDKDDPLTYTLEVMRRA